MAKKKRQAPASNQTRASQEDKPATLKDLLNPELVNKLRAQADAMREDEAKKKEEARKQAEEARKKEQKRLDNNFEHLLENSQMDWRKFK
jgi:Protein of unknown function (DUF3886)